MKNKKSKVWFVIGICCLLGAIGLSAFNVWDSKRAGESVEKVAEVMIEELPKVRESETILSTAEEDLIDLAEYEIPDYILNPEMDMPIKQIDAEGYIGILEIPMFDLKLPVASTWSSPQLRKSPCRYDGSAYQGNLIISAHNYDTHFGKLKGLQEGEQVTFTDIDGNVFRYHVSSRETIQPEDIEGMKSGEWDLTLFTCTYGGQQRVTIRCELEE